MHLSRASCDRGISYYDSLVGRGHQGIERTYQHVRLEYYWYGMFQTYVKSCPECQQAKRPIHAHRVPLKPLPFPGRIFSRVHIDIVGPLQTATEGYTHLLLKVDAHSKFPGCIPLRTTTANEIAWTFYKEWICRYGSPNELLSDRGQNFLSKLVTELCNVFQITRLRTRSYHPQTNATCERLNSVIGQALRAYCAETKDGAKLIPES